MKVVNVLSLSGLYTEAERLVKLSTMNDSQFEAFYNQYSRPLWGYVCRLADSPEIADEVAQEAFLRFLSLPRRPKNEKAYLYRIATNLVYDHFRRQSRESGRLSETDVEPRYEPFAPESDIGKIFEKLKLQERALLWLAYVEGHDHKEIAEILGIKSASVRVLLFRARRNMAEMLEEKTL
jgi:RNA polymerase sigma-70 factor (ECF subfamily)